MLVRGCCFFATDVHRLTRTESCLCRSVLVRGHYFFATDVHRPTRTDWSSVRVRACPWLLSFATDVYRPARTDWSSVKVRACPWLLSFATDVHRLTRNYALINKRSLHCPIPKETPAFPCVPLAPLRENSRKLVFPMTKAWQNTRGHRPYCRVLHGKLFLLDVVSINICALSKLFCNKSLHCAIYFLSLATEIKGVLVALLLVNLNHTSHLSQFMLKITLLTASLFLSLAAVAQPTVVNNRPAAAALRMPPQRH